MKAQAMVREEATVPWFAARDAHTKSAVEQQHYTDKQQAKANAMRFALELCYSCKEVYVTYRQRFIAVKVEHVTDFRRKDLRALEASWTGESWFTIAKVVTKQGFIYRIKFL